MKKNYKGAVQLVVIGLIALAGACGFLAFKPKKLDGASRNAAASQNATASVNAAHEAELQALKDKSSSAAAGVAVVGRVAGAMPDTPVRSAIVSEVGIVQSKLEPPNPIELLAAEKRAKAFLSGQLEEAHQLVTSAYQDSAALRDKLSAAEAKTAKAEAAREVIDLKLSEAAAKALGAEQASNRWKLGLAALAILYLYTKATHLSPGAIAEAAADIKKGTNGLVALDGVTTRLQQSLTRAWQKHFHPSPHV